MRYRDFASNPETTHEEFLRTVSLYVLNQAEWALLTKIRESMGPSRIIEVRSLSPRFRGFSIDVLCEDIDSAWELLGKWQVYSVQKPRQAAVKGLDQRAMRAHD